MRPFFSIITCTLDSGRFIKRNINSVKTQKFRDYEHIFIDGYSKDATVSMVDLYRKDKKNNIKLFFYKKRGISSAMNKGIRVAKGRYLIFLHSDDFFYDSSVLQKVHRFLIKNDFPDWVYGKIQVVDESGKRIGKFPNRKLFQVYNQFLLKVLNYIPHQSVFMNEDVFKKIGKFDERLISSMDYDLWLRLSGKRCVFVDSVITNYLIRSDAQSSARKNKEINDYYELKVVKKHLNHFEYFIYRIVKFFLNIYNHALYK